MLAQFCPSVSATGSLFPEQADHFLLFEKQDVYILPPTVLSNISVYPEYAKIVADQSSTPRIYKTSYNKLNLNY